MPTPPPDGVIPERWYWVRLNGHDGWFPAAWDQGFGWNNGDTWEDFHHQVVEWKLIPLPEELL